MTPQPDDLGTKSSEEVLVKHLNALVKQINAVVSTLHHKNVEVTFDTIRLGYCGQSVASQELTVVAKKVL